MPRMYCQSCGKDMGSHKYHDKSICKDCKMTSWRSYRNILREYVMNCVYYNENGGYWIARD